MTVLAYVLALVAGLAVLLFVAGRSGLLKGRAPSLGVRDGRLKPPSRTPNSVSSQARLYPDAPRREDAAIEPFPTRGDGVAGIERLRGIVAALPGAQVIDSRADYLYAQFTTPGLNFVDDTEFWHSVADEVIHVRSASRIGRKDFGVNRQRLESIRRRYLQQ